MIRQIDETFSLRVVEGRVPFPEELTARVDKIWEERSRSPKLLFDGTVFQVLERDEKGLKGQFIPYRYFYAAHVEPTLFVEYPLLVAAVTGITYSDGKYLLAKRSGDVTEDPLKWEFAPSGGISSAYAGDEVDYQAQLLEELEEELGIEAIELSPLFLIEGAPVLEICVWIEVSGEEELSEGEYMEFKWLAREEFDRFMEKNSVTTLTKTIAEQLSTYGC